MSMLIMKKEKLHEFVKKSVIFPPVKIKYLNLNFV